MYIYIYKDKQKYINNDNNKYKNKDKHTDKHNDDNKDTNKDKNTDKHRDNNAYDTNHAFLTTRMRNGYRPWLEHKIWMPK